MRLTLLALLLLPGLSVSTQDFEDYEWVRFDTTNSPIKSNFIHDIAPLGAGRAYVSCHGKLYYIEEDVWQEVSIPFDYENGFVYGIEKGGDNLYIVVRDPHFLLRYDLNLKTWEKTELPGLGLEMVVNDEGVVVLALHFGAPYFLCQIKDGVVSQVPPPREKSEDVLGLEIAPNGDLLVGYRQGFFRYYPEEDGTYRSVSDRVSELSFYDFAHDSKGKLWATSFTTLQLHGFENGRWEKYSGGPEALKYDWNGEWKYIAYTLLVLPDDRILVSSQTHTGFGVFDGYNWEAHIAPNDDDFSGLYRIYADQEGWIWGTTPHSGLMIFRPMEK
ncbi:MAG: hypothetical protein GYB31_11985 [Bacteroidetes bacterium]|nr:hypothetical protein [Bacteroidota bacterium]